MSDEPRMAASPSYAMGQLQRAFDSLAAAQDATSLARAETKIARWRSVIAGMVEGSVSVGSRTPVSGTPAWVTLEVAHGYGPEATVVTLIPDGGRAYLSKFYDDTYMIEHGYVERDQPTPTVGELLAAKRGEGHRVPDLVVIEASHKIGEAVVRIFATRGIDIRRIEQSAER